MLRNYLKIAGRTIRRNKGYSLIHIIGLTIGIATCIIVGLYVRHELSYDRFHPNADRLYRIVVSDTSRGMQEAIVQPGLATLLQSSVPDIEQTTTLERTGNTLTVGDRSFFLNRVLIADTSFAEIFGFKTIRGDLRQALQEPGQIVLTESLAHRIFGDSDPLEAIVSLEKEHPLQVAAIIQDVPSNSHFTFDALCSLSPEKWRIRYQSSPDWMRFRKYIYLRLAAGAKPAAVERTMNRVFQERQQQVYLGALHLQPLTRIHLFSDASYELNPQGDVRLVLLFSGIGVLVLLMAIINYSNLTLASALRRTTEIGIRKTLGARPAQLKGQFVSEALLYALIAFPLALALAQITIPLLNRTFVQTMPEALDGFVLLLGFGLVLAAGGTGGFYPALFLSRLEPRETLQGNLKFGRNRSGFRKSLMILQFLLSGILVFCTITLIRQMHFLQHTDVGFHPENLVTFRAHNLPKASYPAFRQSLLSHATIRNVTYGQPPGIGYAASDYHLSSSKQGYDRVRSLYVGRNYVRTVGLSLLTGRTFQADDVDAASHPVIINEAAAAVYGITPQNLGTSISHRVYGNIQVIGIVKNFHNSSLHHRIMPIMLQWEPDAIYDIMVRLDAHNIQTGLEDIRTTWKQFVPDAPIRITFVEDRIQAQYQSGRYLANLFNLFGVLAVILALLGLIGLAGYMTQRRTKEISIRKILGASLPQIIGLLIREYLVLIGLAAAFGLPIAAMIMAHWLHRYAYSVPIGPGTYLITLGSLVLFTGAVLIVQVLKTALSNPTETLRYE